MAFQGWSDEAISFFEELEAENTKVWWEAHKPVYEGQVAGPMRALMADLAPEYGEGKLFRPYRDTRFSADKSPYKTTIAAILPRGGYVQFSAAGLGAGVGSFHLASDQLDRYRRAVDNDRTGVELERIVAKLGRAGCALIGHDVLKTAPRGYPKDHPRIELLRRKGIAVWREFPDSDWLDSKLAPKRIAAFFATTVPLKEWLGTNVGDTEAEPR
jgi:uncharacterized protein (TIGR02453 family)